MFSGHPSLTVLCPWKGTASNGTWVEVFQRSVIVPIARVNLARATHPWLSCSQHCSRVWKLGWETMKRYPMTIPGCPFAMGPFMNQTINAHFSSRWNRQILSQKTPLQTVGLIFKRGVARWYWWMRSKYYICPTPLRQAPYYPPNLGYHTLALQGTVETKCYRSREVVSTKYISTPYPCIAHSV